MSPRILLSLGAAVLLALQAAVAQQFLPPGTVIDAAKIVPPPPADNSPAGQADIETILRVQTDRTEAQVERAKTAAKQSPFLFGQPVLGEWFRAGNLPKTAAILRDLERQVSEQIGRAKNLWKRPRPFQRDPRVHPAVDRPGDSSYPSGHSTQGAVFGMVLDAAFPGHTEAFDAQTREMMWCRVIGGVHYPSDTTAGLAYGRVIGRQILASPDMQKALETMRAEAATYLQSAGTR